MSVTAAAMDPNAMAVPALFVNQFQIANFGGLVRISLAEAADTGANYRVAVVLSDANARELALSILNLLGGSSGRPS